MNSLSDSMLHMQDAWKRGDQAIFVRMLGQLERGIARHLSHDVHGAE